MSRLLTQNKRKNLIVFFLYPIIASFLSFKLDLNFVWSIFFFFVVPSIHLSILIPKSVKKTLVVSPAAAFTGFILIDTIAHLTRTWYVPSVFSVRIFNLIPFEDLIWGVSFMYFIIMFYEYFFDSHNDKKVLRPKMKIAFSLMGVVISTILLLLTIAPHLLQIPFFYLWFGMMLFLLPVIVELARKPHLIQKFILTAAYFFPVTFIQEVTSLKLDYWTFPGNEVIGWINIFGVTFPFEEFFFWFVLTAMGILAYYEFFDDDEK